MGPPSLVSLPHPVHCSCHRRPQLPGAPGGSSVSSRLAQDGESVLEMGPWNIGILVSYFLANISFTSPCKVRFVRAVRQVRDRS